jgi:hypothetical protein
MGLNMTINSLSSSSAISQIAAYGTFNGSSRISQAGVQQDSSQVSDFGKLMNQLESLQQSDPEKFKETTAQIADKLEAAAKEAANSGDSQQASALNDMASKFKTASETGDMPDLRPPGDSGELAGGKQGVGGHHGGPPPMGPPPSSDSDSTSSTTDSTTDDSSTDLASSLTAQLLSSYQTQTTDPMSVLTGILKDVFSSTQATTS